MEHIETGSIDMVLADPPYGTTQCKWDSVIDLASMWAQVNRIIKPNGAVLMTSQTPFDKVLGCSNLKDLRYEWIWEKTAATGFLNSKRMPMKAHENVLCFYKKLPTYNPQKTSGHIRKTAARHDVNSDIYGKALKNVCYDSTDRYPRDVQVFKSDKQKTKLHPAQKPVSLMEYLIKTYTNPGEKVLDFAMGSGTTGIACINTNREFIGIELDDEYYKIASRRIKFHK